MTHRPLPVGHHNADTAAELLGISKRALYKRLREIGWLIVDKNGVRSGNHNLPRREIVDRGWAYSITCSYGAGTNKEIDREYRVPVFTQEGFQQIKKIIIDGAAPPEIRPAHKAPAPEPEPLLCADELRSDPCVQQSRAEALAQLRKLGL